MLETETEEAGGRMMIPDYTKATIQKSKFFDGMDTINNLFPWAPSDSYFYMLKQKWEGEYLEYIHKNFRIVDG